MMAATRLPALRNLPWYGPAPHCGTLHVFTAYFELLFSCGLIMMMQHCMMPRPGARDKIGTKRVSLATVTDASSRMSNQVGSTLAQHVHLTGLRWLAAEADNIRDHMLCV
jgi:hypothetical protein